MTVRTLHDTTEIISALDAIRLPEYRGIIAIGTVEAVQFAPGTPAKIKGIITVGTLLVLDAKITITMRTVLQSLQELL